MKIDRLLNERFIIFIIFALALGIRLLHLGTAPLSDYEATWGLQAWHVARDDSITLGPQPGYSLLTGILFFVFGSSNALARFWPALSGSLLVLVPYQFRRFLGHKTALLVAFGLAIDPGMVALSRLAGGPMLAVGFGFLALSLLYTRKFSLAGIFGGLSLLGGQAIIQGGLILVLTWLGGSYLRRFQLLNRFEEKGFERLPTGGLRTALLAVGSTILLVGTLFFQFPQGLSALAGTLPAYLHGWVAPSGVSFGKMITTLLFYQPLILIFGLIATVRGWIIPHSRERWLSLWLVIALILAIVYPGRQTGDLVWVLLPLWILTALEINRYIRAYEWETVPAAGQAVLIFILMSLSWLNLAGLTHFVGDPQIVQLRWIVIGGTLALGVVTTLLVGMGWSPSVAQRGLAWGSGIALGMYGLASMWGVSQLRQNAVQETWTPPPAIQESDLLMKTLGDLSEWKTGLRNTLDVLVTVDDPALKWALRDWPEAEFSSSLGIGELPSVIISSADQKEPSLTVAYRGQDFGWRAYPAWEGFLPDDWSSWVVFRQAPEKVEQVILWARGDLFPGGTLIPSTENQSPDGEQILPDNEPFN